MNDAPLTADTSRAVMPRPLIFGEVLFDHFPDERKVLGGAPFNVAWNLQGLGFQPFFVSAVGDDSEGAEIRERMASWGMDVQGLQRVEDRPTGKVSVTLADNQPSYQIEPDQAYDFIPPLDTTWWSGRSSLLYHGSLVFRGERTRETLRQLISESQVPRFVDINIREPHFDRDWLPDLLSGATWVKLNDEELSLLASVPVEDRGGVESGVAALRERFGNATYFVTCGSDGAYALGDGQVTHVPAPKPSSFEDTVGAGDAFASAVIGGLLKQLPPKELLSAATGFASKICEINGATTEDRSIYREVLYDAGN